MLIVWMRRLEIRHLWMALPTFFLVVVTFGTPLRLLDFWWHLKMGEVIVTTGSLPGTDIFSFTASGTPFLLQSWMAEVLLYGLYDLGGLRLIVAVNAALLAAAFLCVYSLYYRELRGPRICGLLSVVLIVPLVIYSNVRPQVFSILLFALFYRRLSQFRWWDRDRLWQLPLLMVAWVNLHGGFPLGLGLIGIFWLEALIRKFRKGDKAADAPVGRLTVVGLATAAATLVNPAGLWLYGDVLAVLGDPPSQQFVSEWQAPELLDWTGLLGFYVPLAAATLALLLVRRAAPVDLILYLVFAAFGFSALRNAIWFAIVVPPLMARQLGGLRWFHSPAPGPGRTAGGHTGFNLLFAGLLVSVLVGASPWVYPTLKAKPLWEPSTPAAAVDFMEAARLKGHIFHPQMFGDFLIWRLWPQQRSFIDGRVHLFESAFVRDYFAVFDDPDWEARLEPYDIRYLFLSRSDPGDRPLYQRAIASQHWNLLYVDDLAAVFERLELSGSGRGSQGPGHGAKRF